MHTENTPPQPACKHTSKQHLAGVQCAAPPPMQQYGITNPHDLVRPFVELTPKHFIASPQDPERTRVSEERNSAHSMQGKKRWTCTPQGRVQTSCNETHASQLCSRETHVPSYTHRSMDNTSRHCS
jgi:hypothetical protein